MTQKEEVNTKSKDSGPLNNMFRRALDNLIVIVCLCFAPLTGAVAVDIGVYKGELRISIPAKQTRDTLLLQYRTKTREVLRITTHGLKVINAKSKESLSLDDRSVNLADRIDDGYWNTEIVYGDLNLDDDDYRIEGMLTFHMAGSQQTRNFSVYLRPEFSRAPTGSGIDWNIPVLK